MLSQYIPTTIETKALCSVLRKAESQGEHALIEKMIEICDPQSGLRFEEIWGWWTKHKVHDRVKFEIYTPIIQQNPATLPIHYTVTC